MQVMYIIFSYIFAVSGKTLLAVQAPPDAELLVPQPDVHTTSINVSVLSMWSEACLNLPAFVNIWYVY